MKADLLSAFDALAIHSDVSAALCEAAGSGALDVPMDLRSICTCIGLPQARAADVERSLAIGKSCGIFTQITGLTWCVNDRALAMQLSPLLEGAKLYRTRVHCDADTVDVVLTKPPAPSQVSMRLDEMLQGGWGFRDTKQLLPVIAESARNSFGVMTPFFDEVGAKIVLNLFERAKVADRYLILRTSKEGRPPQGLAVVREALSGLGVEILDFRLGRSDSIANETFHAKVVLADADAAYVGSSNMNQWSFEYSLELGLHVRGKSAAMISRLIQAVRGVSIQMSQ